MLIIFLSEKICSYIEIIAKAASADIKNIAIITGVNSIWALFGKCHATGTPRQYCTNNATTKYTHWHISKVFFHIVAEREEIARSKGNNWKECIYTSQEQNPISINELISWWHRRDLYRHKINLNPREGAILPRVCHWQQFLIKLTIKGKKRKVRYFLIYYFGSILSGFDV